MEYLTLGEYVKNGGSNMAKEIFARYELKARRLIDRLTHGRLAEETQIRDVVKMCMQELIGAMAAEEADGGPGSREIAAISNDGVSVSYRQDSGGSAHRYVQIVRSWLDGETAGNGIPLLYAGV